MANTISTLQTALGSLAASGPALTDAVRQGAVESSAAKAATHTAVASNVTKTDHADLSALGGLVAQASAGSDVRLEKVSALQQQISAGTYHVSAHAVAGKIVDSLLG